MNWDETQSDVSRTGPGPGTSVLLPLIPRRDEATGKPVYPPARIMIIGGGGVEGEPDPKVASEMPYLLDNLTPAQDSAEILDFSTLGANGYPSWRWTANMRNPRVMPDPVLLPDGKVLVVGGAKRGRSGGFLIHFGAGWGAEDPVFEPELFDPERESWQSLCPKSRTRLYHATAALLPDARVVVAGHDGYLNRPDQRRSVYELEVFSPPYLFRGARPEVTGAPASMSYDSVFAITTNVADDVARVALLRQSSITHQTNTDQRYVELVIEPIVDRHKVWLRSPPDGGIAPPGYYMLFVLNHDNVPSVAHWIRIQ